MIKENSKKKFHKKHDEGVYCICKGSWQNGD